MEEILHHLGCKKPWDKLLINRLAGFLPSTVSQTDWCLGLMVWNSRSRFPKPPRDSHPRYSPTGKVGVEGGASSVALLDAVEAVVGRVGSESPRQVFKDISQHTLRENPKRCQNMSKSLGANSQHEVTRRLAIGSSFPWKYSP